MDSIDKALRHIDRTMSNWEQRTPVSFEEYLNLLVASPDKMIRNIFQLFHDMITGYLKEGVDEYPDDPESIHYFYYDCRRLFIEGTDHPFFADRLFANRLVNLVEAWKRGAQQNKIYIFEGPPGSGKSTYLNNLLMKFEKYANMEENACYEVVWRLSRQQMASFSPHEVNQFLDKLTTLLDEYELEQGPVLEAKNTLFAGEYVEVACPSHDHPLLIVPKQHRRAFFDDLLKNDEIKWKLFTEKEYEWVFKSNPCTICSSLYQALLARVKSPAEVFKMVYARPYRLNRRLGEGVSVFAPGDRPARQQVLTNEMLQGRINSLLKDSNAVNYTFSRYAKTNNGIYALMDIKSHNVERLIELHNIISEGVHKVEDLEENVNSLFLAIMNPEDKKNVQLFQSFSDRIEYIKISYVLDLNTEVEIYRNIFGRHLDEAFLPRVLHNFARVVISSRLSTHSEALLEWIGDPEKYRLYCDENLQLLKMELYTGHIPPWLSEEDRKGLTAKVRRSVIDESEGEGDHGFSGRDTIKIFNEFYSTYARKDKMINMADLYGFFTRVHPDLNEMIPAGFLDSLVRMYDYTVLQEVKESLYYYNEEQIAREIQNYLFACSFEPGATVTSSFTGDKLEISEAFFEALENRLLGAGTDLFRRLAFRRETQKEYASTTLTQEVMAEGRPLTETGLYQALHERYVHNLKEKSLDPFLENENFRRAIKDFDSPAFKTYDKRIRSDVAFLIGNLCSKFHYTKHGAKEVCIYVIDNDLAGKFADS
ncbi:MAG: serine protein kinase PrkA [Geobacteraceae bacterium]|nr:serine protein kinase PrkA [Geobacteraceae bacterium]